MIRRCSSISARATTLARLDSHPRAAKPALGQKKTRHSDLWGGNFEEIAATSIPQLAPAILV